MGRVWPGYIHIPVCLQQVRSGHGDVLFHKLINSIPEQIGGREENTILMDGGNAIAEGRQFQFREGEKLLISE